MTDSSGSSHGAARLERARRWTRATPALRCKAPADLARRWSSGSAGAAVHGHPALCGGMPVREEEDDATQCSGGVDQRHAWGTWP
jgi:hypothetical protein